MPLAEDENVVIFRPQPRFSEVNTYRKNNIKNFKSIIDENQEYLTDDKTVTQYILGISNLESLNATLIKQGVVKKDRFTMLLEVANEQRKLLEQYDYIKSIKKIDNATYVDAPKLSQFDQSLTKALNYNPKDKEPSE